MLHSPKLSAVSEYILSVAPFNGDLSSIYFRLQAHSVYAHISVREHFLLLEVVEATFEPLLATTMLEFDEVNSVTELVSSRRAPAIDVKGLPESCCNCL